MHHTLAATLILIATLPSQEAAPHTVAPTEQPTPKHSNAADVDKGSPEAPEGIRDGQVDDAPPLSSYDLQRREQGLSPETEPTLLNQLIRTTVALGIVVALIYLLVKVALPRLIHLTPAMRGMASGGEKRIRILERLALDPRHGVVLLEVEGGRRVLLGTGGEKGVALLDAWQSDAQRSTFSDALSRSSGSGVRGGDHG